MNMNPTESATHPTTERLSSAAHTAVDKATLHSERMEDRLRESGRKASVKSHELGAHVEGYFHERPLTALGIAVAVGIVLGSLMRR